MLLNSKAVAFFLSVSVAGITLAFLSLVEGVPGTAMFVAGALAFSSTFLLSYFTLEFLVFREINKIYSIIYSTGNINEDFLFDEGPDPLDEEGQENLTEKPTSNPIRRINREIESYAKKKEQEIDKLKKLEAYRREFLANVSHELKTPIFAAQGYVLTLLDGAVDDDRVKYKFLKKAAKSLNGLDALVQDLLTLSQIESGVITMQFESFDIQALTLDIFDQFENKTVKRKVSTTLENRQEKGVTVYGDYYRIGQVLSNLIGNAIKYNHEKGEVKVRFDDEGPFIRITVADNGPGIPQEHLERVFERFYRVDKSRSKKQGGSGLGLAIVKHILEGHNTKAEVKSVLNVGTSFSFRLKKGGEGHERNQH